MKVRPTVVCYFILLSLLEISSCKRPRAYQIAIPQEVNPEFIINNTKNEIFFSINNGKGYNVFMYDGKYPTKLAAPDNCANLFFENGQTLWLQDTDGDEKYNIRLTNTDYSKNHHLKRIYSFESNSWIIAQYEEDIFFINVALKRTVKLNDAGELTGVCYNRGSQSYLFSFKDHFTIVEGNTFKQNSYMLKNITDMRSAFVSGDQIYFSAYGNSDYFNIYRLSIDRLKDLPKLLLSIDHDLLNPQYINGVLFFIEVIKDEYRLSMIGRNGHIINLTKRGVVYTYGLWNDQIVFTYADGNNPRGIYKMDLKSYQIHKIYGSASVYRHLKYSLMLDDGKKSTTYILTPPYPLTFKGVIINLHPGMESDFSPRWDTYLHNLCMNGYVIISPNYPSSFGQGRKYLEQKIEQAQISVTKLVSFLKLTYKKPVYLLASSSANVLMEQILEADNHNITAAISCFGIPNQNFQPKYSKIPMLLFLGYGDPLISYSDRISSLSFWYKKSPAEYIGFENEGHWIRKKQNMQLMINKTLEFLDAIQPNLKH